MLHDNRIGKDLRSTDKIALWNNEAGNKYLAYCVNPGHFMGKTEHGKPFSQQSYIYF